MKKTIIKTALAAVFLISLVAVTAEADTAFNQVLWSGSWTLAMVDSAKLLEKQMEEEK